MPAYEPQEKQSQLNLLLMCTMFLLCYVPTVLRCKLSYI